MDAVGLGLHGEQVSVSLRMAVAGERDSMDMSGGPGRGGVPI
jgi:hypothetical protein